MSDLKVPSSSKIKCGCCCYAFWNTPGSINNSPRWVCIKLHEDENGHEHIEFERERATKTRTSEASDTRSFSILNNLLILMNVKWKHIKHIGNIGPSKSTILKARFISPFTISVNQTQKHCI